MLRFFQDIRRRLIMPDNVRKYLIYAVGEIFLVVIGVLIALQVNNWNEMWKEKKRSQKALISLFEESEDIVSYFITQVNLVDQYIIGADNTAQALRFGYADKLSDDEVYLGVGFYPTPAPTRTTYYELTNSGELKEIESDSVRFKIARYYQSLSFLEGQLVYFRDLTEDLIDFSDGAWVSVYDSTELKRRTYKYDLKALSNNETFKEKHLDALRDLIQFQAFRLQTLEKATAMCQELAKELDTNCSP